MKRGSALLLVLGMLSFMVISAVAFSAFMRYSRLPASYLRRSSSSRLLAKAALARAIDIVDSAINDNPHPGVGYKVVNYDTTDGRLEGSVVAGGETTTRNHWRNHVFTESYNLLSAASTVSTLTLEGLAYLPPALINEARYYSRHSKAAKWLDFGYDSGRFAFCAVDVSDHFNVNKVLAGLGRDSSPDNRFSLAYVFEDSNHRGYVVDPPEWDDFVDDVTGVLSGGSSGNKLPFVSLADLNLAVGDKGQQFIQYFPFVDYIKNDTEDIVRFRPGTPVGDIQGRMAIVADGYFPSSADSGSGKSGGSGSGGGQVYDLFDDKYKPFSETDLMSANFVQRSVDDFFTSAVLANPGAERMKGAISILGLMTLWDYLDVNSVPLSLAIPSVERNPMVCGVKARLNAGAIAIKSSTVDKDDQSITLSKIEENDYSWAEPAGPPSKLGQTRRAYYKMKYALDGKKLADAIRGGSVDVLFAYPFLREGLRTQRSNSYSIDGHVEFFLASGATKFRTGNKGDLLHFKSKDDFVKTDYKGDGVLHVTLDEKRWSPPTKLEGSDLATIEKAALGQEQFSMVSGSKDLQKQVDDNPLLVVTYEQEQGSFNAGTEDAPKLVWKNSGDAKPNSAACALPPIGEDGSIDSGFTSSDKILGSLGKQVSLRMAVWLRVRDEKGVTVDLVPAHVDDDNVFNADFGFHNTHSPLQTQCGAWYPLMPFECSEAFPFGGDEFEKVDKPVTLEKGIMCGDPRWNWAPEHWFSAEDVTKDLWHEKCGVRGAGKDRDIFMATSDAGYMQSIYELAFLPRLMKGTGGFNTAGDSFGDYVVPERAESSWAENFDSCKNHELMWTTYRPFDSSGLDRDNFEAIGFVSEGGGTKLNPFSGDKNVLVAAFANTPESWWSASTNDNVATGGIDASKREAQIFNKTYAWSEMNGNAKFAWSDTEAIAEKFRAKMHAQKEINDWEDAYDELWAADGGSEDSLMGATLAGDTDDLFGVDRKFFYGYWRDCFAVKQQLFLIFVRAEPRMMGGGIVGQTPPQLGARAVALVWRNPNKGSKAYTEDDDSASNYTPHQTRVLFYRQLD